MKAHQAEFPIATMCRVLEVSTSGYYAWLRRQPSNRDQDDAMLTEEIRAIHTWSRGTYGAPRIHAELQEEGLLVACKRVARLMQADGLQGVFWGTHGHGAPQGHARTRGSPGAPTIVHLHLTSRGAARPALPHRPSSIPLGMAGIAPSTNRRYRLKPLKSGQNLAVAFAAADGRNVQAVGP